MWHILWDGENIFYMKYGGIKLSTWQNGKSQNFIKNWCKIKLEGGMDDKFRKKKIKENIGVQECI